MLYFYLALAVVSAIGFAVSLAGALRDSKVNHTSGVVYFIILATIGVAGLSAGIVCALLIYLHVM